MMENIYEILFLVISACSIFILVLFSMSLMRKERYHESIYISILNLILICIFMYIDSKMVYF